MGSTRAFLHSTIALLISLGAFFFPTPRHSSRAQDVVPARAQVISPNGWEFVDVARRGQNGFTSIAGAKVGPNDAVVVRGVRNDRTGLFIIQDGTVTEVAAVGTTFSNTTITAIDIHSSYDEDELAFLPNGSVVFGASVQTGSAQITSAILVWKDGVITMARPANGYVGAEGSSELVTHFPSQFAADSRWLITSRAPPTYKTTRYGLTNGVQTSYVFTFTETGGGGIGRFIGIGSVSVGPNGDIGYVEWDVVSSGSYQTGFTYDEAWSIKVAGAAPKTLYTGAARFAGGRIGPRPEGRTMTNGAGEVVVSVVDYNEDEPPFTRCAPIESLMVYGSGYERIATVSSPSCPNILQNFYRSFVPVSFGNTNLQFTLQHSIIGEEAYATIMAGPDIAADKLLKVGDSLFGDEVVAFEVKGQFSFRSDAAFAVMYRHPQGISGIALVRKVFPRWINSAGGAWSTASNWNTNFVPGNGSAVTFDLGDTYAVDLGTQQVRDVQVTNGDVTLRNGALTITDTQDSGESSALQIQGENGTVPRLTILGARRSITDVTFAEVTGTIMVGSWTGPGELRIQDAIVWPEEDYSEGIVGLLEPATATVSGYGSSWLMNNLSIGVSNTAKLRIEECALVAFGADTAYVGGSILSFAPNQFTAQLEVDGAGSCHPSAQLGLIIDFIIGQSTLADVQITGGGRVEALTTTVATVDHGSATDAVITIDGANAFGPSYLWSGSSSDDIGGLFVSTAAGTHALIQVSGGGVISATQLSLADAAGSSATLFVDGFEGGATSGRRSSVFVPIAPATNRPDASARPNVTDPLVGGDCVIGRGGRSTLQVTNGAMVRCRQLAVGYDAGSNGEVRIEGSLDATGSAVFVDGPGLFDGLVCIGGDASCGGAGAGQRGSVMIGKEGGLIANAISVGSGGRLFGSGRVFVRDEVFVFGGGSLSPGLKVYSAAGRAMRETDTVGTLTIDGDVVISSTGVLSLQVNGASPAQQDRLVVSGTVDMRGTLALNFGDGYAPKQGDTLQLIQADGVTDAAKSVVISGLADGFEYDIDPTANGLVLTARNDGVPESAAGEFGIYVPLLVR
jgi:hypothetical protein